jgi:hypothetical protein
MATLKMFCSNPTISLELQLAPTATTQTISADYVDGPIPGGSTLAHFSHNGPETLEFTIKTIAETKDGNAPDKNPVTETMKAIKDLLKPITVSGLSYPPIFWLSYDNADDINGRYQMVSAALNVIMRDKKGIPIHVDIDVSMRKYVKFPFVTGEV